MDVALLGGTGDIGEGLALRLGQNTDYEIAVGSRNAADAAKRAAEYRDRLRESGVEADVYGAENGTVVEDADVVIASVPPQYATDTVEAVAPVLDEDAVLVCPAVAMNRDAAGFHYEPPAAGSVAEAVDAAAPDEIAVVGGFQNLAAGALSNLDERLDVDVLLTGDDPEAKSVVADLVTGVDGLRPLDAGGLANSAEVEALTPLLINLAINNDGLHDLGVRFQ